MSPSEVLDLVRQVISETFGFPIDRITRDTIAEDVDGWDSLKHTILMVRLQNAFAVGLSEFVAESESVGELADRIADIVNNSHK